ncbi:FHA domain-containing protein [Gloeocapsa sp. PCC 73106]|uniref:FHA domain-containing protein n=1 Tax=Gloeocapsa sp. PCC 73106 TaxID=102232 RepID=UPI0002AC9922|nr:FHA domain-containing protein [Gloeocapsa sp. PCC 73106]ELR99258.1 cyclic nucleotide-binding protein,FHA domain-containing protein [Gloeocapsa sp. PCC 73106]
MISKVSEKKMHIVRWILAIGWLVLIFSLVYDPITPWWTDPENLKSPFRIPDTGFFNELHCAKVQGECLPNLPYAMGARIFWAIIVPIAIMVLMLFGHEFWRRICPLYFFSQIPRALGIKNKIVQEDSWLGRNHLYLQFGLFFLGLNIRILFVNSDRLALFIFLIFTIISSIIVGYLFQGRSWCHYFCPMAPVQMIYTGPGGFLGSQAHTRDRGSITQSMCREVDKKTGQEKTACVGCKSPCMDIDVERSYWEGITKPDQKLVFYGYLGLVIGFYFYYLIYSGNWDYYFSGAWTHEEDQLKTLFNPGLYLFERQIPIPKIIAAPLTLALFGATSYFVCLSLEKIFKGYAKKKKLNMTNEQIQHICFLLCTFASFNIFYMFGGRPNLNLLLDWIILAFNGLVIFVSTLWLYKNWQRSKERYKIEGEANSLRRQLMKLGIDFSHYLGGRSIEDLNPDELYVLANTLPAFTKPEHRLRIYKGVLQERLEDGNFAPGDSFLALQNLRQELSISEEEHTKILEELLIEHPKLTSGKQGINDRVRVDSYREHLELMILELVETGTPLEEAFNRKEKQIMALKKEYSITKEQDQEVLSKLFNEESALVGQANALLAQLKTTAEYYHSINSSAEREQPVFDLLASCLNQKQKLIINKILSILEVLGNSQTADKIARSLHLLAADIVQDVFQSSAQTAKWTERLSSKVVQLLTTSNNSISPSTRIDNYTTQTVQPTFIGSQTTIIGDKQATQISQPTFIGSQTTKLKTNSETSGQITLGTHKSRNITEVLEDLLQDSDPLVQAASLYALYNIQPNRRLDLAIELSNSRDVLVAETAKNILNRGQQQRTTAKTWPMMIATINDQEVLKFYSPMIRVGRSAENDIVFADSRVSQQHAIFYLDENGVSVQDLNSTNGTRIGNQILRGITQKKRLKKNDRIRFCSAETPAIVVDWGNIEVQSNVSATDDLSTIEKLLWLDKISFFKDIKAVTLIEIAQNSHVRSYAKGQEIYSSSQPADELFILIEGEVQMYTIAESGAEVIRKVMPVQLIGELGILNGEAQATTVVANGENNGILAINSLYFEALLAQEPILTKNLVLMLCHRLQKDG